MRAFDAAVVEDAQRVLHGEEHVCRRDIGRDVGLAECALVGCDDSVARVDERRDLVAPQVGRVGPAVQQQHGLAFAGPVSTTRNVMSSKETVRAPS